jgi:hypothetical protein
MSDAGGQPATEQQVSGAGAAGGTPAGAPDPTPPAGAGGAGPSSTAAARPDYLPEKFWRDGAPNVEALAKSYSELEKMRGRFGDEAKAAALAELRAGVPEAPDGYALAKPEGLPDDVVWLDEIPEGFAPEPGKVYFKPDPAAPETKALREWAHKHGLKGEAFGELMGIAARVTGIRAPSVAEREQARSEFFSSLGENGAARAGHLYGQLRAALPEAQVQALDGLIGDKAGFEAIEALVTRAGGARFAPTSAPGGAGLSDAKLREMMRDPRYTDPTRRDPEFVKQIEDGWRTLYPGPMPASHAGRRVA